MIRELVEIIQEIRDAAKARTLTDTEGRPIIGYRVLPPGQQTLEQLQEKTPEVIPLERKDYRISA